MQEKKTIIVLLRDINGFLKEERVESIGDLGRTYEIPNMRAFRPNNKIRFDFDKWIVKNEVALYIET